MDKQRLRDLIEEEKNDSMGIEYEVTDEIAEILCENLQETIDFLNVCNQKEFYWVSMVFCDVSEKYQSQEFIDCLRKNQLRFPEIHDEIEQEIQFALSVMKK